MTDFRISFTKVIVFVIVIKIFTIYSTTSNLILLLVMLMFVHTFMSDEEKESRSQIHTIDFISSCPKPPMDNIPKWLMFPEFEKARFVNHIMNVLWNPHLKLSLEKILTSKLEWRLECLKSKLKKLSHLSIIEFDLGTSSPIISSIRSCEFKCDECAKHIKHDQTVCQQKYCSLELDFYFLSDDMEFNLLVGYKKLRVNVSLSKISLSGTILLRLCDFVNVFPGFSSYTVSLVNYPRFDFNLSFKGGGIRVNYLPKVSKIVEPFLKKTLWTNIIFPRYRRMFIKSRRVAQLRDLGRLIRYGQMSKLHSGALRIALKSVTWDISYSKDVDYAVPNIVTNGHIYYRDERGFSWHCVASLKGSSMLYKTRHIHSNTITRKLILNETITFRECTVKYFEKSGENVMVDIEIRFRGKKWDEILGQASLNVNEILIKKGTIAKNLSIDVVRFFPSGEIGWRKVATMYLDVIYTPPNMPENSKSSKEVKVNQLMVESLENDNYLIIKENLRNVTTRKVPVEKLELSTSRSTCKDTKKFPLKRRESLRVKKPTFSKSNDDMHR